MSWPFLFKNQAFLFLSYLSLPWGKASECPCRDLLLLPVQCYFHGGQGPPGASPTSFSILIPLCVPGSLLWMSHDCAQLWFLKAPTHVCHLDPLTETSQVSRAGGSWRQSQGFLHQHPSTGRIVEKRALRGVCPVDAGNDILSPDCCWTSEVVECMNCVLSQLKVSPISVFCEFESKLSNITFRVLYQEVLSDHFLFCILDFHSWRRQWHPTPVFLPGESQGREAWWAAVYGVAQSRTRLKWLSSSSSRLSFYSDFEDPEGITCPVDIGCPTCSSLSLEQSSVLCDPSHSFAGYFLLSFSSLFGIIFLDSLSEPPPLVQVHVCFHSTIYHPLLPDYSGVSPSRLGVHWGQKTHLPFTAWSQPQHGALQRPGCQSLCVKGVRCPCLVMGKPVVLRLETEAPDLVASLRVEDELGKNLQRETGDVPDW